MNALTEVVAIQMAEVDRLGELLAQIATLTKQANVIKDAIKEMGADGHLDIDAKGVAHVDGLLFRAVYSESCANIFDKAKFVEAYGEATYAKYTKQSASFKVTINARK